MKKICTPINFLVAFLFPGLLFAQQSTDPSVSLRSGKFIPEENWSKLVKTDSVFTQGHFKGKYYVTLQFRTLPDQKVREALTANDIQLMDYIPNNSYTAVVPSTVDLAKMEALPIRSVFRLLPQQKTTGDLWVGNIPAYAIKQIGYADVTVITYEKLAATVIAPSLTAFHATILEDMPIFRSFRIRVPQGSLRQLIEMPFIQWVEPIDPPVVSENLLGRAFHRINVLNEGIRGLKGDGIDMGIWDGGDVSRHLDFLPSDRLILKDSIDSLSNHATHCAGTMAGRGLINPRGRGMAPNVKLYSYDYYGNIPIEVENAITDLKIVVSNHSYGTTKVDCDLNGASSTYSALSRAADMTLNKFPWHLYICAAGNSQRMCPGGWNTISGLAKTAKNTIVVANITNDEEMSGGSSFGPVQDGRVKPEISALGTNVLSTYTPLNSYEIISGTSMAAPGVSGTVALLIQRYKQLYTDQLPSSALIKNSICNTAKDLGNIGPDYKFGYGRINGLAAVRLLEEGRYVVKNIQTGITDNKAISIPAGAVRLKVMLTWNDPAATANANPTLVNDLDLSVTNAASTTLPWILDPNNPGTAATKGVDKINNAEQVVIENPAAGNYTMTVKGVSVPIGPSQEYSLTWVVEMPYIEVTYPNGRESFEPEGYEMITWDNAGISGKQTVQYSIDNGATWKTISDTVPATSTFLKWDLPADINSATALIKVSGSSMSDQSDANFTIMGGTAQFDTTTTCMAGSINFTWDAVSNATHYDLLKLDEAAGQWTNFATDITGTKYTATGLTPNASMWFTIVAKNNTIGAIGDRAYAINRTVYAGETITASGPVAFCEGGSVTLTASKGIAYLWSNGATTQAITVSTAGNYSVTVTRDSSGCKSTSPVTVVTVSRLPTVTINASPYTRLYPGLSTVLTANTSPIGIYSYLWMKDATPVSASSNAAAIAVDINDLGNYAVIATDSNGCTAVSGILAVSDSTTSRLFIYPSPSNGMFQVSYHSTLGNSGIPRALNIYDDKGARMFMQGYSIDAPYAMMDVDMRKFTPGIYWVELVDANGNRLAMGRTAIMR